MKRLITLASLTLLLAACGGSDSGSSTGTGAGSETTADLRSSADFDFSSSREVAIDFDVTATSTSSGLMSLCTKYTRAGASFDIDYDSCAVQTPLEGGVYSGKMDVTNDVSSVVGVVWFKNELIPPVYKEFTL